MTFYQQKWHKLIILILILTILMILMDHQKKSINVSVEKTSGIECYNSYNSKYLPDIQKITPRSGKSIFFHETSCTSFGKGKITITSRQACAVESAAKMNPDLDVYLLFSSPGNIKFQGDESDNFIKALISYKNVKIMLVDYENYVKGTPVEELYMSGKIGSSKYPVSHASDVLRYLTLWKYGGIYLDLDVIVLKSLQDLPLNFAGIESPQELGSCVLSFSPYGIGHQLCESCLFDLQKHFDGQQWSNNGPGVIRRLLQKNCKNFTDILNTDCNGMTVYPTSAFYAIPYTMWRYYFEEEFMDYVLRETRDSYVVHVWNKKSAKKSLPLTSNVPYLYYAKKYCPEVFKACDEYF